MILRVDQNITNSSLEASQWNFHWAYTGFPGCHQVPARGFQCKKSEVKIHSLLVFEGHWQPLVSKVTGIGSPAEVRSWDPRVLWCHAHPRCYPANTVRDSQLKLEKCQILGYGQGGTASPMTPVNPYLGGNIWKKWATFYLSIHLCTPWKPHFGAKYGPRGPPRAIYEPGGPGCHRDTYSIKRFKVRLGWEHLKWKHVKNGVETMSFGRKMSIVKFHPVLANMLLTLSIPSLWLK